MECRIYFETVRSVEPLPGDGVIHVAGGGSIARWHGYVSALLASAILRGGSRPILSDACRLPTMEAIVRTPITAGRGPKTP